MRRAFEEVERPEPRDRSEGDFEAARPVDAWLRRVGVHPLRRVAREAFGVSLVARAPVGAPQGLEELVPAQLPDEFLVAGDLRVEEVYPAPMRERRADARERLDVPVDGRAEVQVFEPEQTEAARQDSFGVIDDGRGFVREARAEGVAGRALVVEALEEARRAPRAE